MTDMFNIRMDERNIKDISALGLAHLGDAVFEIMVRSQLCVTGGVTSGSLHRQTVKYVSATAQAKAAARITDMLTDEEKAVFKRGRNAKVNSVPHNADLSDYHAATGLEALFGWLWLRGEKDRLNELFDVMMGAE